MVDTSRHTSLIGHVLLPGLHRLIIFLAAFAIVVGSWLETYGTASCSMAMQHVVLQHNASLYSASPDTIAFGLWQHCFLYSNRCACSTIDLTYELDAIAVLQAATRGAGVPQATGTAYVRAVPLVTTTVLIIVAILSSLFTHYQAKSRCYYVTAGLLFASAALVSLALGYTYLHDSQSIKSACRQSGVTCVQIEVDLEFILLIAGIGLASLGFIFWLIYSPICVQTQIRDAASERYKEASAMQSKARSEQTVDEYGNALVPWRDANLLDHCLRNLQQAHKNDFLPPSVPFPQETGLMHNQKYPFKNTTCTEPSCLRNRVSDLETVSTSTLHYDTRRCSASSGNTFGTGCMIQRPRQSPSSSVVLDDYSPQCNPQLLHTVPGNHCFLTPVSSASGGYNTAGDNDSTMPDTQFGLEQNSLVLLAGFSPQLTNLSTRHPLNNRVITDHRISKYLQ